jgi:GAF domain-containing protein
MSAQPLTPSNNIIEHSEWNELVKLAENLVFQPDLETQLTCVISTFERYFSCNTKLWLVDSYLILFQNELLHKSDLQLSSMTEFMMKAYDTRNIFINPGSDAKINDLPMIIAVPLMIRDEVLGVIQLERINQAGFDIQDTEFISGLTLQASIALDRQRQAKIYSDKQKKYEMLASVAQINKSVTSNIDLENLLNSVVTLIHQRFGFTKINILIAQGENKIALAGIGFSHSGIVPTKQYFNEQDNSPVLWAILYREPVVINDIGIETRFSPSSFDIDCKSELVLPLISGEIFIGVLDLCSDNVNAFNPDELQIFQSLSENIALAIRNAKLYHSEQLIRQVTERLQDVIGRISADTSYDDVLNNILLELEKILPSDASAIWLLDNVNSDIEMGQFTSPLRLATINVKEQYISDHDEMPDLNINDIRERLLFYEDGSTDLLSIYPWFSEIIKSKQPIINNSASIFEPLGQILSFTGEYSAIGLPLKIKGQSLGMIISVHHLTHEYTDESIDIASTFANYVSVAIENTRLFTAAHDQVWMSTVLQQVTEATQTMTSLVELVETITRMLVDLIGVNACTLYLWDQSLDAFFPQASYGFDEEQQARLNSWDIFPGTVIAFEQMVEYRNPVILNSDTLTYDILSLIFPTYDLHSNLLILFPLVNQDNLLGAVLIDFTNTELGKKSSQKNWDDMYTLIQAVSNQAANAIDNLQIIKSREEEAYISVALLQVAQAIVSLNQLDEILSSIVRITPILVGVKRCVIYLWDNVDKVFHPAQFFGFSKNEIQVEDQVIQLIEFPLLQTIFERNLVAYHRIGILSNQVTFILSKEFP